MKNIITILLITLVVQSGIAQTPEKISFQAVIRDSESQLVVDHAVGVRISILQGAADGVAVYREDHEIETNSNGLATLEIGNGYNNVGVFSEINWGEGTYYIKSEIDPDGGTDFSITGTSPLLSVPYALHAKTVEIDLVNDADADTTNEIQTLVLTDSILTLSNGGGSIVLPSGGSGLWSEDETRIFYTNGNVGIGTNEPVSTLSVGSSGLENVVLFSESNIGGNTAISGVDSYNDDDKQGVGVRGISEYGKGVYGSTYSGIGVVGESEDGTAAEFTEQSSGVGVVASSFAGNAIEATGGEHGVKAKGGLTGVYGATDNADGAGVEGRATSGFGVIGHSTDDTGIFGSSDNSYGGYFTTAAPEGSTATAISAYSENGVGIEAIGGTYGIEAKGGSIGVFGETENNDGAGVKGLSSVGYGVWGESQSATGVIGKSEESYGGYFTSNGTGTGLLGSSKNGVAVKATGGAVGLEANGNIMGIDVNSDETGINAVGGIVGGQFTTIDGTALKAISESGNGGYFEVQNGNYTSAIYARNFTSSGEAYGGDFETQSPNGIAVRGLVESSEDGNSFGGYFETNSYYGVGVYGVTSGGEGAGVFGENNYNDDYPIAPGVKGVSTNGAGVIGSGGAYDFYADGPGTDYASSSSRRWKTNIKTIQNPLDLIINLNGVYFDWDSDHGGKHDIGFIAEEMGEVIPEIVNYEKNGKDAISIDYSKVTPLLAEAIKALVEENKALKEKNQEIENRLSRIEALIQRTK